MTSKKNIKPKMVWIKLIKYFQGGCHSDYMLIDNALIKTEDQRQEIMESWGEGSDGGHAYGYRVELDTLKKDELPPQEWLQTQIRREESRIKYYKGVISTAKTNILEYQKILNTMPILSFNPQYGNKLEDLPE